MKKGLRFDSEETEVVSESQPTKTIQFITFFHVSAPSCLKLMVTILSL